MSVTEQDIFDIIESHCGICIKNAQKTTMHTYLHNHLAKLQMSLDEYYTLINSSNIELSALIDEAAINETYFFREEQQFDYLTQTFFPQFKTTHPHIHIWSAACSTGEEPISLYLAATSCGLQANVYATDIDTVVLSSIKKGLFRVKSFRSDGKKYLPLIESRGTWENHKFKLQPETQNTISYNTYNLMNLLINQAPPIPTEGVDLIFLRNLFIYFEPDLRNRLLKHIAEYLKPHALLFLSVNEIASIECDDTIPLIKEHVGSVYFLRKVTQEEKELLKKKTPSLKAQPIKVHQDFTAQHKVLSSPKPKTIPPTNTTHTKTQQIPQSKKTTLADLYCQIQNDISMKDFSKATEHIHAYPFRPENAEFAFYFLGLIEKSQNHVQAALAYFQKATYANPDFWPGYFQQITLENSSLPTKDKKKLIILCKNSLNKYIQNQETWYTFIMEQFSPEYFLTVCESLNKK